MLTSSEFNLLAIVGESANFRVAVDVDEAEREQATDTLVVTDAHVFIFVAFVSIFRRLGLHVGFVGIRLRISVTIADV